MKAILLVRVSTTVQELDEQEKELYQLAIKEGYAEEDIIPICEKESGIKLSEEERLGLNRLKEVVDTEQVKDVYIWEVSRLARTKKVLFSMQEYFVSRKIQVTFKEPSFFKLLNNDGSINDAADMTFTLYAQMAEAEMRTKKARFKRSKKQMAEEGRFSGGTGVLYGYKIVNGYYVINEEEAAVVREIFTLYNEKKIGRLKLAAELKERGYNFTISQLEKMIKEEAYTGTKISKKSGLTRKYPVIISKELWEKTVKQRAANKIGDKYKGRRYDLGAQLFRCPCCNTHIMAISTSGRIKYGCYNHHLQYLKRPNRECDYNVLISAPILDYILWMVAKRKKIESLFLNKEESKEAIQSEINSLVKRIEGYNRTIFTLKEKGSRITDLYIDGVLSKSDYKKRSEAVETALEDTNKNILALRNRIDILQKKINAHDIADLEDYVKNIDTISQKEKYEIVHEIITDVKIELAPEEGKKAKYIKIFTGAEFNTFLYKPFERTQKLALINADGSRVVLATSALDPRK